MVVFLSPGENIPSFLFPPLTDLRGTMSSRTEEVKKLSFSTQNNDARIKYGVICVTNFKHMVY